MPVDVRVPTILRTYTDGASQVSADGSTLTAVLDDLDASYPGIRARIVDETGTLRRFVNVYVGNDDVRFLEGLDTAVTDGSQISIIPAVAGGADRFGAECLSTRRVDAIQDPYPGTT